MHIASSMRCVFVQVRPGLGIGTGTGTGTWPNLNLDTNTLTNTTPAKCPLQREYWGQSILLWFACMSWSSEDEQAQARAIFRAIIAFERIPFLLRSRPGDWDWDGTGMGLDPNLSAEGFQQRKFWKQKKKPKSSLEVDVLFFILQHRSVRIGKNWEILSYQEPRATKSLLLRFLFWLS